MVYVVGSSEDFFLIIAHFKSCRVCLWLLSLWEFWTLKVRSLSWEVELICQMYLESFCVLTGWSHWADEASFCRISCQAFKFVPFSVCATKHLNPVFWMTFSIDLFTFFLTKTKHSLRWQLWLLPGLFCFNKALHLYVHTWISGRWMKWKSN